MRRTLQLLPLATMLLFATPFPTEAQGAFLDWILRMSGPGFVRVGALYTIDSPSALGLAAAGRAGTGAPGSSLNIAAGYGFKVHSPEGTDAEGRDISLLSLSGTVDVPVLQSGRTSIGGSFGLAGHVFTGDDFDSFLTGSIPIQLYLATRLGNGDILRLGFGANAFHFPEDAFTGDGGQLDMGVTDGMELGWGFSVSYVLK